MTLRTLQELIDPEEVRVDDFWRRAFEKLRAAGTTQRAAQKQANVKAMKEFNISEHKVQRFRKAAPRLRRELAAEAAALARSWEAAGETYRRVVLEVLTKDEMAKLANLTVHEIYPLAVERWRARALNAEQRVTEMEVELTRLRNDQLTAVSGTSCYGPIKPQKKR